MGDRVVSNVEAESDVDAAQANVIANVLDMGKGDPICCVLEPSTLDHFTHVSYIFRAFFEPAPAATAAVRDGRGRRQGRQEVPLGSRQAKVSLAPQVSRHLALESVTSPCLHVQGGGDRGGLLRQGPVQEDGQGVHAVVRGAGGGGGQEGGLHHHREHRGQRVRHLTDRGKRQTFEVLNWTANSVR